MNARRVATLTTAALALAAASVAAKAAPADSGVDRAVLASLAATYGIRSSVVAHVDLTGPFGTTAPWTLVVAKQPDDEGLDAYGAGGEGAVSVCFVRGARPQCSDALFRALYEKHQYVLADGVRPLYALFESRVVRASASTPLLALKACSAHGGNGSCGISTFLFAYDAGQDRFRVVFSNLTGSNNNQATRFIEDGPLQGDVVVATPTDEAPFTYWIEVYRPAADGAYGRVLRYRGRTGYGDGNRLSVIDSEMPTLLARFGHWKPGDALPVPPVLPAGCTRLTLRKGVEWCAADRPT